jgi:hypothetical protein
VGSWCVNLESAGCHTACCSGKEQQKHSRKGNNEYKGGSDAQGQFDSFQGFAQLVDQDKAADDDECQSKTLGPYTISQYRKDCAGQHRL